MIAYPQLRTKLDRPVTLEFRDANLKTIFEVLSQVALGTRERAVIIKVGELRMLLGVAPGRVSMLQALPADTRLPESGPTAEMPGTTRPTFSSLLKKSMGL